MANLSAIKLPNGTTYSLKDSGALQLTGGQVTGPVSFGDSVTMDEVTTGDVVVNGSASFTNNIQANTINGVEVGTNPKFTDTNTVTTVSTSGSGNAVTAITASNGALTVTKGTTFLTSHQDISGKADKSATVSTVAYDSTNKKITKTINGTTSDVVTVATLKTALGSMPASDVYSWAKASSKPTYTASEVGALASNTTYVSKITTTAGAHTAISNKSGAVSFNVPTKTSHLTNDSGFITSYTDTKVTQTPLDGTNSTKNVLMAYSLNDESTNIVYKSTYLRYNDYSPSLTLISRDDSTYKTDVSYNGLHITTGSYIANFGAITQTANHIINLPDKDGTIALTSDIPTVSYPVTSVNSKTGAVSLTASDVGALASNTTYVSKITTTAGAHTAISNKSGAVSFNVPTKTSHLTNDSGFLTSHQTITKAMVTTALGTGSGTTKFLREDGSWATPAYIANTDTKLQVAEVTSATQYYPLVGTGTTAATRQYDTTGFKYKGTTGTTSAVGSAIVELGNSTASGTAGNKQAQLIMYGSNAKKATITLAAPSADIALALPTSGGTLALTSQIPTTLPASDVYSWAKASTKPTYTASEVGALASNTTYVSKITTSAGTHSAISNKSGAVSFNVPTKTSHLTNDSGFTTNTGTVTKVTAGTGLSIGTTSGGNFTTSGTINHTNSVTAQTTQALYPIKIDAQGHISAYGSAVTSLPASDVSDWAKAASKPTYTASEVGAVPTTRTVNGYALSSDISLTASDVGAAASSAIPTVSTITVNTTTSKGTFVGSSCHKYGRVVTLTFRFRNTSSIASGADLYTGTLSSSLPVPYDAVSSVTYYGAHALVGVLFTDRSLIIRNASNSALQFGSSNSAAMSFTYVCQ